MWIKSRFKYFNVRLRSRPNSRCAGLEVIKDMHYVAECYVDSFYNRVTIDMQHCFQLSASWNLLVLTEECV